MPRVMPYSEVTKTLFCFKGRLQSCDRKSWQYFTVSDIIASNGAFAVIVINILYRTSNVRKDFYRCRHVEWRHDFRAANMKTQTFSPLKNPSRQAVEYQFSRSRNGSTGFMSRKTDTIFGSVRRNRNSPAFTPWPSVRVGRIVNLSWVRTS
jgi:hypothetical protein